MQRIEQLVRELEAADPAARATARELMTAVMELHGDAMSRIAGELAPDELRRIASDDVVRSVLLLYDLHPDDVGTRVRQALEKARPYIESHGGRVELLRIADDVVHLRLDGSCGGCPSSARTVKFAIEGAILDAAPEVSRVIADGTPESDAGGERWELIRDVISLGDGTGRSIDVSGRTLFFCRAGDSYYAWGNSCPACGSTLEGSVIGEGSLRCPQCGRRFDLHAAGRANDDPTLQLEPFPLLIENGHARVAIP